MVGWIKYDTITQLALKRLTVHLQFIEPFQSVVWLPATKSRILPGPCRCAESIVCKLLLSQRVIWFLSGWQICESNCKTFILGSIVHACVYIYIYITIKDHNNIPSSSASPHLIHYITINDNKTSQNGYNNHVTQKTPQNQRHQLAEQDIDNVKPEKYNMILKYIR